MTALPRFRPVLVHDVDREVGMGRCPSEDVLILYAAALPDDPVEAEELLDGWTVEAISTHLGVCDACRDQVAELGELTGALREDRLEDPPAPLWDEMAAAVMSSIEGAGRDRDSEAGADVIPLHPDETLDPTTADRGAPAPARASTSSATWWRWAAAAVLVLGVGGALLLARGLHDGDGADAPLADADLVPSADEAAALAAELGLELSRGEPTERLADAVDLGAAFDSTGWSSLQRDLADLEDVDALELALAGEDPVEDLIELDAEELEHLLAALESKT